MSATKKRLGNSKSPQDVFDRISDLLIEVKEVLGQQAGSQDTIEKLEKISSLAELFTRSRNTSKTSATLTDSLDREGVHLWNISTFLKEEGQKRTLFAALRLAAFRLVEAGIESSPSSESLVQILQIASKTGSALLACGQQDAAVQVFACAAKFEEILRSVNVQVDDEHMREQVSAIVAYYTGRMEAAWKDDNETVAFYMLQQAIDQRRLNQISPSEVHHVVIKVLEIGKSLLKTASSNSAQGDTRTAAAVFTETQKLEQSRREAVAVKWLQMAFQILEGTPRQETESTAQTKFIASKKDEIKRAVLRSLARAYFLASNNEPGHLARAEASIDEILTLMTTKSDIVMNEPEYNHEMEQLQWMKLAVIKRRNAGRAEITSAFFQILECMHFTEETVTDIIQELALLAESNLDAVTEVAQRALKVTIEHTEGHSFVARILFFILFHAKTQSDRLETIHTIRSTCSIISNYPAFSLNRTEARGCQCVLWLIADKLYRQKKWTVAAEWYIISADPAFGPMSSSIHTKSIRKASLCYIQQGEYAEASLLIGRCSANEAATHYVTFLTAVHQGSEDEATTAVQNMLNAPDFDRKMLLLATQLAHENHLRRLLLTILQSLLHTLRSESGLSSEVEGIMLTRCIVRLVLELLNEPMAETLALLQTLLRQISVAKDMIDRAHSGREGALILKDVSWLWRTVFNSAVEGCNKWPGQIVTELFDMSVQLMESYKRICVGTEDLGLTRYTILALFSSVAARVFAVRQSPGEDELRREIVRSIDSLLQTVKSHDVGLNRGDEDLIQSILRFTLLFKLEQLCRLAEWDAVLHLIKAVNDSGVQAELEMYEALTDVLWSEEGCPSHVYTVLHAALENILHSSLNQSIMSVEKFSRWLRAICTTLLARNRPTDRHKALSYAEQAADLIHRSNNDLSKEDYPLDERRWIFTVSYNAGVECFGASLLDEAKRWFEVASILSNFVLDPSLSDKVTETYRTLLARVSDSR